MSVLKYIIDSHECRIAVGSSLSKTMSAFTGDAVGRGKLFLIFDANVYALHGASIEKRLSRFSPRSIVVPSGESTKSVAEVNSLHSWFIDNGISRQDFILAVGGGVTTDIAGYAASTILRGVRWGAISTTLLGMVDAAIGGKTGINHPSGKNLIGAFWQPSFVICDTTYLQTLPGREYRAAYGELLKYAALMGGKTMTRIINLVECQSHSEKLLESVTLDCIRYKMTIVKKDEREMSGLRVRLNLGHTFAHAIENTLGYGELLHGEAVTLGLYAAAELSKSVRRSDSPSLEKWQEAVSQVMKSIPKRRLDHTRLLSAMKSDKKRNGLAVRFVLLDSPAKPILVTGVRETLVRKAIDRMMHVWTK